VRRGISVAALGSAFCSAKERARWLRFNVPDDPCELDVTNEGGRIVEPLTAVIDLARRRAPTFTASIMTTIAQWRKLDSRILHFCAGERKNCATLELICSRRAQSSKNEDDPSSAVKRQAIWEDSYDET
jgi:hypothetical protein